MEPKEYKAADGYTVKMAFAPGDDEEEEVGENGYPAYPEITVIGAKGSKTFAMSEPNRLPPAYAENLRKAGVDPAGFFFAGYPIRNEARAFVDAAWGEYRAAADARKLEHARKEAAIDGLSVVRAAWDEQLRYERQFRRMMEDEYNDGARPPRGPQADVAGLAKKYPRAAAYLKAESFRDGSGHWARAKAGGEAVAMLLAGASAEEANRHLQNWLEDNHIEVD